jgi:hypothetical protein
MLILTWYMVRRSAILNLKALQSRHVIKIVPDFGLMVSELSRGYKNGVLSKYMTLLI